LNRHNLYAIPTQKSLDRFKDQIRALKWTPELGPRVKV
jgi:hypothetical protein